MPQDEELPELSGSALEPGTAEWWKENMRTTLVAIYDGIGKARPIAAANQQIRLLERLAKPKE